MAIITLSKLTRYQGKLDSAIKDYVARKLTNIDDSIPTSKGTAIPSGTNLNNLRTAGNYYIASDGDASGITNLPLQLCGKVIVVDSGNGGYLQLYIPNHSSRIFQRNYWSNAWTSWAEYEKVGIKMTSVLPASGETVSFTSSAITGDAYYDIYTSVAGLNYSAISISGNTITVTFEPQASDVTVALVIK